MTDESSLQEPTAKKGAFPATQRARKGLAAGIGQVDLDLTPVMNLFMVLVPFLVSMAVFTQVAVLDFSLPPAKESGNGAASLQDSIKELDISIVVSKQGFRIVGTGKQLDLVPLLRGQYQFDQLRILLKAIKFQYPSQKGVVLVLEPEILYDDIVKFMDVCRESQFPDIGLSGEIG